MSSNLNDRDSAWVSQFLASRRSTRDFLPTPIPQEILDQILTDALTAPSWSNTRPFKIAIATDEVRDRISGEFLSRWSVLSRIMRKGLKSKLRLIYSRYGLPTSNRSIVKPYVAELKPRAQRVGKELYELFGVERGDREARDKQWGKNYSFFGAPVEMFIYIHKSLHVYAASDAGLMMENLMLSAHGHGLGTCAQGAVNIWDDVVRKEFDIPKNYRLLCGLAIGYPSDSPVNSFKAHRIGADEVLFKPKKQK
jgi:nitroreductase